jgi:hypothetical protein
MILLLQVLRLVAPLVDSYIGSSRADACNWVRLRTSSKEFDTAIVVTFLVDYSNNIVWELEYGQKKRYIVPHRLPYTRDPIPYLSWGRQHFRSVVDLTGNHPRNIQPAPPVPKASIVARPMSPRSNSPTSPVLFLVIVHCGSKHLQDVTCTYDDTISHVKAEIELKHNIPADHQILTYRGEVLENSLIASSVTGVDMHFMVVDLVMNVPFVLTVFRLEGGDGIMFDVYPNYSIDKVKSFICYHTEIPKNQQEVWFEGEQLKNDMKLSACGINRNSHVFLKKTDGFTLWIFRHFDSVIKVDVVPDDSVALVKMKIQEKEGIPVSDQLLCLDEFEYELKKGPLTVLFDDKTLKHYKIGIGAGVWLF